MHIVLIVGSIRQGRQSHHVAYYLAQELRQRKQQVAVVDLALTPLPMMEERAGMLTPPLAVVQNLSHQLHQADAFVLVTPEYHGSFSGVLKNALDYFWAEFAQKPIGVAAASAGKLGGINASTQLQHVILSLRAFTLPTKLLVSEVQTAFDATHQPLREEVKQAAATFLDDYLWFAQALVQAKPRVAA